MVIISCKIVLNLLSSLKGSQKITLLPDDSCLVSEYNTVAL